MTIFTLDGKTHAVSPVDVVIMYGPGVSVGDRTGRIVLHPGDTITMTFDNLLPGEGVRLQDDINGVTVFFRPIEEINHEDTDLSNACGQDRSYA